MIISRDWLASYFEKEIPDIKKLAELFTFNVFEIESALGDSLDVKVLPDRSHYALCHRGIAYELSAILGQPMKDISFTMPEAKELESLSIKIKDEKFCRRYMGIRVNNISVTKSPEWLVGRLSSIGQRSINNIVDITNFVMFDIGQPLHAFDADEIKGGISVRRAKAGEKIDLLPETGNGAKKDRNLILKETDFVIADESGPLALAGVKGGLRAQVTDKTKNIILESANFDPATVRKTSIAYDIRNDSSKRFENGIVQDLAKDGMERACALIKEINSDAMFGELCDLYPVHSEIRSIEINLDKISKIIGVAIPKERVSEILENLSIKVTDKGNDLSLSIPAFRLDLNLEEDIVEEIARIYGYDKIPKQELPAYGNSFKINKEFYYSEKIREIMVGEGFSEVYTYGLSSSGYFEIVKSASDKNFVRETLFDNLKQALTFNVPNAPILGLDTIRLFEIGKVFPKSGEKTEFGIGVFDALSKGKNNQKILESILNKISEVLSMKVSDFCTIKNDIAIIDFDKMLHGLPDPTAYDVLPEKVNFVYKKISQYPFALRDIAVWVPVDISSDELSEVINEKAGELLVRKPRLVDEYKKDDQVSYAFRLVFQSYEKTLTDLEVNEIMIEINKTIESKGWKVR